MANGRQIELNIDMSTAGTQGAGNDLGTCSTRQDSINGWSGRLLLDSGHGPSTNDDFELLWRLRKYLVLLGVLSVGVTYNAGLTPPGGFWTLNKDGHDAGDPVLHVGYSLRYELFFYCNATAFAASLVLVILLLSKSVARRKMWIRSIQLTMMLDLFSLLGAFAAGSCRAPKSSIYIWVLVFAVLVYVVIHTLVSRRSCTAFREKMTKKLQTVLDEILSRRGASVCDRQASSHPEKDVEEARKFILMLATFAATITYQAGLNPPGGFWAENQYDQLSKLSSTVPSYKHRPATSVLRSKYLHRYNFFVSCNATSFVSSLVTVILLLSPELSSHGIRSRAVTVCVVVDLFSLIGAYAAGCCRSVGTSIYVVLIGIIVWILFALLAGAFVHKPVADWLTKIEYLKCIARIGRIFSLESDRNGPGNAGQDNPHATDQHTAELTACTPGEDSASEAEHQASKVKKNESHREHQHADKQQIINAEKSVPSSEQLLVKDLQSENTNNIVCNQEDQFTQDALSDTGHPSIKCQQATNNVGSMSRADNQSADNQQVENKKEQSLPTDIPKTTVNTVDDVPNKQVANMEVQSSSSDELNNAAEIVDELSEEIMTDNRNEATNGVTVQRVHSFLSRNLSKRAGRSHSDVSMGTSEIEIVGTNNTVVTLENGNTGNNEEGPSEVTSSENDNSSATSEHLKKSRTYLLLAILAASLTYQSGLNPPGGFWSTTENNHLAGDPILEDTHHRRYIAFFYLNAVAFVASLVMIIMLLNKRMSDKVTKRYALQFAMIVDLLALTGAYVMGSSRETNNSIYISLLLCLVVAYVVIHVLIAHVIPKEGKRLVARKLKQFSCKHLWPKPHQFGENRTGDVNGKDWERRRNLLLMLAVLTATVTYQAGMNPPGSVWSDDKNASGAPGNPILQHNHSKRYDVFYYSNSFTLVSSVVITILLVNKASCEHGIKSYALRVCLVAGLVGLLIAYAAGSCRKAKESIYLIIIAIAVLISLVIQVLILSSTQDSVGGPMSKFVERQLKWLLRLKDVRTVIVSETQGSSDHHGKKQRKRHKYLMLLAALAASVTYQAGLNPPGGFWSDDVNHVAGNPVLHDIHPWRYRTFFIFNGISFISSIVVIMFLLNKSVRKKDVPLKVLHLIMILDLLALMTAFSAGSCRKFRTSVYVYGLVIAVVVYLVLTVGVASRIAKYLKQGSRNERALQRDPESAPE